MHQWIVVCPELVELIASGKRSGGSCFGPFDTIDEAEAEKAIQDSPSFGFCECTNHVVLELYR